MGEFHHLYAVLMGDLIDSEGFADPRALHAEFNDVIGSHNDGNKDALLSPLTITLGDEFQGLYRSLTEAGLAMRRIRHALLNRGIACRFALGQVELVTPLNTENAWNMMGPGLSRTRDKLNKKSALSVYRFAFLEHGTEFESLLDAIGAGLTVIERGWTEQQRDDIVASLDGASAIELGQARNVSPHSVYKVRNAGHYETYRFQWDQLLQALHRLDKGKGYD